MRDAGQQYRIAIGAWVRDRLMRRPDTVKIDAPDLDLFAVRNVLNAEECAVLIAAIDANLAPSRVMAPMDDPDYRTSQTCNFDPTDPLTIALEARIHEVMGIQNELGEPVQGQRYGAGQQFKPHWDFFLPTEPYWPRQQRIGGQRTWTAMLYLNAPDEGGQTVFVKTGVSVKPRPGNLLVWNNLDEGGDVNRRSMHQGTPVTAGVKYVITKWFRERPWTPQPEPAPAT